MKYFIYVGLIGFMTMSAFAIEEPSYKLIRRVGNFEIRAYEGYIVAETAIASSFEQAGNVAFGRLYNYISGNNRSKKSIPMTAPVNQQPNSEKIPMTAPVGQEKVGQEFWVSFVMPRGSTLQTLPEPLDPAVRLKEIPGFTAAVVRYSGMWSEKRYQKYEKKLRDFIDQQGLKIVGQPIWARYNPPFMPFFLRRNEIIIPIEANH